jgi:hypothetical protein
VCEVEQAPHRFPFVVHSDHHIEYLIVRIRSCLTIPTTLLAVSLTIICRTPPPQCRGRCCTMTINIRFIPILNYCDNWNKVWNLVISMTTMMTMIGHNQMTIIIRMIDVSIPRVPRRIQFHSNPNNSRHYKRYGRFDFFIWYVCCHCFNSRMKVSFFY